MCGWLPRFRATVERLRDWRRTRRAGVLIAVYGGEIRRLSASAWKVVMAQAEASQAWLTPSRRMALKVTGIVAAAVMVITLLLSGGAVWLWTKYSAHHAAIAPLLTVLAGLAVAAVALLRHFAQKIDSDGSPKVFQRRLSNWQAIKSKSAWARPSKPCPS